MKCTKFKEFLPIEKTLTFFGFICTIVCIALIGLTIINDNTNIKLMLPDGETTLLTIALSLLISLISILLALGNILIRLHRG